MKRTTWVMLAATAVLAVVVLAGKDDIRQFHRMHNM